MTCLALIGAMVVALILLPFILLGAPVLWMVLILGFVIYLVVLHPQRTKP
jgi:predicted ABC-type sugar transport system permease subunit